MKKIIKLTTSVLLAAIMMVASIMNVKAASDTISIGQAYKVNHNYIANVTFSYKVTTDGRYLYCLDLHRNTASNTTAKLVSNSSYVDGGILYILKNGYPEKSITGDKDKDYYITQTAVWWYLDSTHGMSNLGNGFKSTGSDPYNLRRYVQKLVNEGIAHRYDGTSKINTSFKIDVVGGTALYPQSDYYLSNEIKATQATNISAYTVTLENQPANTLIFKSGQEFQYTGAFTVGANETFRVKVPGASAKNTGIIVSATATGGQQYAAYEYQPVDGKMQNVVLLEKERTTVKSAVKLSLTPTVTRTVTINKIDASTKKPLAGAKLVIKNADTKAVVASFTTTEQPYVISNLKDGSYTVEETEAPNGYALSKEVKSFTLSEKTNNVTVTFENEELGSLSINKIDAKTKKPLAGAVLSLKDSNGKELAKWTTTINAHIIKNLAPGTYTVTEIQAPKGYVLNTKPVTVVVTESKKSYSVTMENTPKNIVININKIDKETNKPLAGAVLVVKDSTGKVIVRFTTTEQAHVITDIANGTYTVEEESAPAGYIKSDEKVSFTVDDNHQSHQITISNTKETPVPDTGTESIIFVLIGAIILGIGLEFILKNAKA